MFQSGADVNFSIFTRRHSSSSDLWPNSTSRLPPYSLRSLLHRGAIAPVPAAVSTAAPQAEPVRVSLAQTLGLLPQKELKKCVRKCHRFFQGTSCDPPPFLSLEHNQENKLWHLCSKTVKEKTLRWPEAATAPADVSIFHRRLKSILNFSLWW